MTGRSASGPNFPYSGHSPPANRERLLTRLYVRCYGATAERAERVRECIVTSDLVEASAGSLCPTIDAQNVNGVMQLNRRDALTVSRYAAIDLN
jgi:hypothetical protein